MVIMFDGNSEIGAHVGSNLYHLTCFNIFIFNIFLVIIQRNFSRRSTILVKLYKCTFSRAIWIIYTPFAPPPSILDIKNYSLKAAGPMFSIFPYFSLFFHVSFIIIIALWRKKSFLSRINNQYTQYK